MSKDTKEIDTLVLGIDDGHSHIKIYGVNPITQKEFKFKIPSKASMGVAFTSDDQDSVDRDVVIINDQRYTISNLVSHGMDTRIPDYPVSEFNKALIHQCLSLAEREGILPKSARKICASTGLPISRFYGGDTNQRNESLISRKNEFLTNDDVVINALDQREGKPQFKFIKHIVSCEAQAAFFDASSNLLGGYSDIGQDLMEYGAGILDIGGLTTDCLVSTPGGRTFFRERTTSSNKGVLSFYDDVEERIRQLQAGSSINKKLLEKAIATGKYGLGSNAIDVSNIINAAKKSLALEVKNFADRNIGTGDDLAAVICVGGGSIFLEKELKECMPNVLWLEDREYANARGFYKIAVHLQKWQQK